MVMNVVVPALMCVQEYLRTSYEHEPEFVNGEIIERGMTTFTYSDMQRSLCVKLDPYRKSHNLFTCPAIRVWSSERVFRIPDVAVFIGRPAELPADPPLIAVEIASPDDRLSNIFEKFREYRHWGVRHIWLIEPHALEIFTFDGSINKTEAFVVPEYGIRIEATGIFSSAEALG